jgi:hypothetical protein
VPRAISLSEEAKARILIDKPELGGLLVALDIATLTPSLAVRHFILRELETMPSTERAKALESIRDSWGVLATDADLVAVMKAQAFVAVPSTADPTSPTELRRAEEIFDWRSEHIRRIFQKDPRYFPPEDMRSPAWTQVLTDLGMKADMDNTMFLRCIEDVERMHSEGSIDEAFVRAKHLLEYLADTDRCAHFFEARFCAELRKRVCVPVHRPVRVEPGGHVLYERAVVRFADTASPAVSTLLFTVRPVLADDIAPPQLWFSKLSILSSPEIDTVCEHMHNLVERSEAVLDRWNCPTHTIREVFEAVYRFLWDNWQKVPVDVRTWLKGSACIPVGMRLVRPSRVFFRLQDSLAPFMFELPRFFGSHEQILTELGVAQSPTPENYAQFLSELASETHDERLNPNELMAAVKVW